MDKEMIMPYFPYGIRVACDNVYNETWLVKELLADSYRITDWWGNCSEIPYTSDAYKLVLHPVTVEHLNYPLRVNRREIIVSDLLCRIVYDNVKALQMSENSGWITEMVVRYFNDQTPCPFSKTIVSQLCSKLSALHFDVFGYIEKRRARSVCEMTYDPYEFDQIWF